MTVATTQTPLDGVIDATVLGRMLDTIAEHHGGATQAARREVLKALKQANADGRSRARARLDADGGGSRCAAGISQLEDVLVTAIFRYACRHVYPMASPSKAERLAVAAVGGYGRGMLAPGSDVDLLFLLPYKTTPWTEQVCEWMLYMLWDVGQKVGHATRNVEECLRQARADMTIRTAILEARLVCGDAELFGELAQRFDAELVRGTGPEFIAAKLAERDARHRKDGDTRYLVEPNVKEGKGGLRDLNTLFWIAMYYYRVHRSEELVGLGVLSKREYKILEKAADFLWAVRCQMHFLTGKAEERLSFDIQREIAESLGYQDHPGLSAVERFMKHYFLVAKDVGDLTRILCAALEDQQAKVAPGITSIVGRFANRVRKIPGTLDFLEDRGRITIAAPDVFRKDPVNILRLFHMADFLGLEFHPDALKAVSRSLKLIGPPLREDDEANRLFMSILTSRRVPALILRRMNEAGVLGRFIPDFGRIVSMMQFNMYHHYTVDEHLLRSVDVLSRIEKGVDESIQPLATRLIGEIDEREALYVAVLIHDIAKGRPEDHSLAGARVARKLCPRLGLSAKQTDLVAWLIEEHLTMSMTAQSRDLNDRKTIEVFADRVQSLDRLNMLLVLTCCDIRAVGPGVWNGWKGQLLRTLYLETEVLLTGGFSAVSRKQRTAETKDELREALAGWSAEERETYVQLHYEPYLLSVAPEDQVRHAHFIRDADRTGKQLATMVRTHAFLAITEITVLAPDHPRLLSIIAGSCAATGANIADAQIFTTTDGRALDTIMVNREFPDDEDELRRAGYIGKMIEEVLSGRKHLPDVIATKAKGRRRTRPFKVSPAVTLSNGLSNKFTVIEVECLDRTGLLSEITAVLSDLSLDIASAHITTFGEKVIDTFYVTDLFGHKITNENRQAHVAARLKAVMAGEGEDVRDRMPSGIIAAPAASKEAEAATRKARVELS